MHVPADFKEFLSLLHSEGVEYLLVGGYAVSYYGQPRATGDMDIWINPTAENAARVAGALRRFGFSDSSIAPTDFTRPDQIFRMGTPPLRIELLTGVSGLTFSDAYSRRVSAEIDGQEVWVISVPDLLANKRAAGRRKDLDDADRLS